MRVDTYFTGLAVDTAGVAGATAVVIDVLRATTTLLEGLANGAREVYPVASTEEAVQLAASLGRENTLLCGERRGLKIEGFDLGNSPREYTSDAVRDRQLVMTTTNGTRAFIAVSGADQVFSAAFANLSAVVKSVMHSQHLVVVCAGKEDRFSMDDVVCAGMLIGQVLELAGHDADLNDAGRAAVALAEGQTVDADFLATTAAGAALVAADMAEDLPFVARVDRHVLVPEMVDRIIRLP